ALRARRGRAGDGRFHRSRTHSSLSTDCFTDIYRVLSLPAFVLPLRGGGGATARRSERQLAGSQAGCPVPSVLRGWARPCAASELATNGTPRSSRDFLILPGLVRLPGIVRPACSKAGRDKRHCAERFNRRDSFDRVDRCERSGKPGRCSNASIWRELVAW